MTSPCFLLLSKATLVCFGSFCIFRALTGHCFGNYSSCPLSRAAASQAWQQCVRGGEACSCGSHHGAQPCCCFHQRLSSAKEQSLCNQIPPLPAPATGGPAEGQIELLSPGSSRRLRTPSSSLGSWGRRAGAGRGDSGACIGGAGLKMAYLRPVQILARRDAISPLIPRHPHCLSLRCHSLLFKPRAGGRGGVGRGGGVHTRVWNSSELDCARLCCCARLSAALSCYSFCRFGARLAELQKYKWLLEQEFWHLSFGLLFDISALLWFDAPADEVVQRGEAQRGGGTVGSSVV